MSHFLLTSRDSELVPKHHICNGLTAAVTLWPSSGHAISPGAIQGLGLLFIAFVVLPLASLSGAIIAAVVNHRRNIHHPYAASLVGAVTVFLFGAAWAAVIYGRNAEHMGTIFIATIIYTTVPVLVIGLIVGAVAASKGKAARVSGEKDE